jgi:hypothetical protein
VVANADENQTGPTVPVGAVTRPFEIHPRLSDLVVTGFDSLPPGVTPDHLAVQRLLANIL